MASADVWSDFFDASTHYTGPPLTDAMVVSAERTLGYALPASYLQLLRVKNGGRPRRQCYPTAGTHWTNNHVRVLTVFGIGGRWGIDSEQCGTRHLIAQAAFFTGDRDRRRHDPDSGAQRDHARLQCPWAAGRTARRPRRARGRHVRHLGDELRGVSPWPGGLPTV